MPDTTVTVTQPASSNVVIVNSGTTITVPGGTATSVLVPSPTTFQITAISQQGPPGASSFTTVHTYAVSGTITVPSGEANFIPPFFFQKKANQTSVLKKVRHQIHAGISVTAKIQKNGADLTGYTGLTITPTPTNSGSDAPLADGDLLSVVVTAVSGSPQNLTLTLVIEHTIN